MEIIIASRAGFCFGVKRAVDTAFEVAKSCAGVFTLGPIIHNPQLVSALKEKGVGVADCIAELKEKAAGKVIVRTHGVTLEEMNMLEQEGFNVEDLTCPYVKKAQHYAKLLREEGYQVIILGDIEHPEVKGLKSYAGQDAIVVRHPDGLPRLKSKVGLVVQTTQPVEALIRLISALAGQARELKVYNTICSSTALRLKETMELATQVEVMVIVGGRNSANTTQLAKLCAKSVPTYHIETASELREEWFRGVKKAGITAGASTPDWIIKETEKVLRAIGGSE